MEAQHTVVICEAEENLRGPLCRAVEREPGLSVVGDAGNVGSAAKLAAENLATAVLLAVHDPDDVHGVARIRAAAPASAVIVLADASLVHQRRTAVEHGAAWYLERRAALARIGALVDSAATS